MKNLFLAKTDPIETIEEHTLNLISNMNKLKKLYPNIKRVNWDLLNYACIFHDFGKCNCKFQNKLIDKLIKQSFYREEDKIKDTNPKIDEIPHGYLSCAFVPDDYIYDNYGEDELKILYQSIYYHHVRPETYDEEDLEKIIKDDISRYEKEFILEMRKNIDFEYSELRDDFLGDIIGSSRILEEQGEIFYKYIITKGLLNKLDYAASGHLDVEIENKDLYEKTDNSLKSGGFQPNDLQQFMINNSSENIIVTASTGIGKTEGALYWIGDNKGFFTLPLKVSINAIYDRVREKIGFSDVALLHSDTYSEYLKRNNDKLDIDYYDKTKQLSMPLTICTLDQLIDFIFKYKGFEMKLATLSYSKLVIDEIQMYSPEFIAYLIVALRYIDKMGGKFAIVTATLPEVIPYFLEKQGVKFKKPKPFVKKNKEGLDMKRHKVTTIEEQINLNHLKTNYKNKKVLIIVNTVKQAQQLYDEINDLDLGVKVELFHSKFIKKDRSEKERDIFNMGQLSCKESGIWITTQVVEASLDIDFDVLYTELSDVSGLFQRMGRVFRNRELMDDSCTNVYVYLGDNKPTSGVGSDDKGVVDRDIFNLSKEALVNIKDLIISEKDKMDIVSDVYSIEKIKNTNYFKKINEKIRWANGIEEYKLGKSEEKLRDIKNVTVIPLTIYNENIEYIVEQKTVLEKSFHGISKDEISKLKVQKQIAKNEIRKLTVDIGDKNFNKIYGYGLLVDEIEIGKYETIGIVDVPYSKELGLDDRNLSEQKFL